MCRYYATKHKPAYTRLCYRYRDMRGNHVPGQWQCGQYPRPARRSSQAHRITRNNMCRCGMPAVSADRKCEKCYVYDQLATIPKEAKQNVQPDLLRAADQHIKRKVELNRPT